MFSPNYYRRGMRPSMMQQPGMMPPPMMGPGMGPPGMGPGMPPPGMGPDMQGGGYGPPPGYGYAQPGFGEPVGFLPIFSPIAKAIGSIFGRRQPTAAPATPSLPPLPELFYRNRPQFCQTFCPPTQPGAGAAGGGRRRRRRRRSGLSGWGW